MSTVPQPVERAVTPDEHLRALLLLLRRRGYAFVTPTPATHARVVARGDRRIAGSVEDVLGWSLPFRPGTIDDAVEAALDAAGAVEAALDATGAMEAALDAAGAVRRVGDRRQATVRVSRLQDHLFLHSAFPTDDERAVFFGPDSYRFADLLQQELRDRPAPPGARMVDIGAGSGVGAIVAAAACPGMQVHMTDVNPRALHLAGINAAAAGVAAHRYETDTLDPVPGAFDIVTANPPYIIDGDGRLYRDGGAMHGGQVSLDMARMALARLAPHGRLILYTGSAIVRGDDALKAALAAAAAEHGCTMRYREIDPDVFGEELEHDAYRDVDRIALVAAVLTRGG